MSKKDKLYKNPKKFSKIYNKDQKNPNQDISIYNDNIKKFDFKN